MELGDPDVVLTHDILNKIREVEKLDRKDAEWREMVALGGTASENKGKRLKQEKERKEWVERQEASAGPKNKSRNSFNVDYEYDNDDDNFSRGSPGRLPLIKGKTSR